MSLKVTVTSFAILSLLFFFIIPLDQNQAYGDILTNTISVGDNPQSIVYHAANGNLYVANSADNTVSVIDGTTDMVIATVPVGSSPQGLAYNSANGDIYVVNFGSHDVSVIDGTTNTVVDTVSVGFSPKEAAYNSANGDIYVTNSVSTSVSVISGLSNTVIDTINFGFSLSSIAYNLSDGNIYVSNTAGDSVSIINGISNTVIDTIGGFASISSITYNSADRETYVLQNGGIFTVSEDGRRTISTSSSLLTAKGIVFNSSNGYLYVGISGDDTIAAVYPQTGQVIFKVPVGLDPVGVSFNPVNGKIYAINSGSDSVSAFPGSINTIVGKFHSLSNIIDIAYNSENGNLYATEFGGGVFIIDSKSNTVIGSITVESNPWGIAYNPTNNQLYVANQISDSVSVIDATSNTVLFTIPVGNAPYGVAYNSENDNIYVVNRNDDTVSVISGSAPFVIDTITVGNVPENIEYNSVNHNVYVSNGGSISVINMTNTVIDTIGVGGGSIEHNPVNGKIYAISPSAGQDTLSIISSSDHTVIDTIDLQSCGDFCIAYNAMNGNMYVGGTVIDGESDTIVTKIVSGGGSGPQEYNPSNGHIYFGLKTILSGTNNPVYTLVSFDTVNADVNGFAFNPSNGFIYALNSGNTPRAVSVIEPKHNVEVAIISIPSFGLPPIIDLGGIAYNPSNGNFYVSDNGDLFNTDELAFVHVISGTSNTIIDTIEIPQPFGGLGGVTYNPLNQKIYVPFSNKILLIDGASNTVVSDIPVSGLSGPIMFNSFNGNIYAISSGKLHIISGTTDVILDTIDVSVDSMTFNPANGIVYAARSATDIVNVISGTTNEIITTVAVDDAKDIAYNSADGNIYVAGIPKMTVINGISNTVIGTHAISDSTGFDSIAYNPVNGNIVAGSTFGVNIIPTETPIINCVPPNSGIWIISFDCTISGNVVAPGNVLVEDCSLVTIEDGGILNIDFANFNLTVEFDSGVLIESGGKIT